MFGSYSWSANIVGRKRWLLFPPGQEDFLRDTHGQLIYDATSDELNDYTKYKAYDRRAIKYIDLIQKEGEIMFVPTGWHHQVWNIVSAPIPVVVSDCGTFCIYRCVRSAGGHGLS